MCRYSYEEEDTCADTAMCRYNDGASHVPLQLWL